MAEDFALSLIENTLAVFLLCVYVFFVVVFFW